MFVRDISLLFQHFSRSAGYGLTRHFPEEANPLEKRDKGKAIVTRTLLRLAY